VEIVLRAVVEGGGCGAGRFFDYRKCPEHRMVWDTSEDLRCDTGVVDVSHGDPASRYS
jgi:hypothetical protein